MSHGPGDRHCDIAEFTFPSHKLPGTRLLERAARAGGRSLEDSCRRHVLVSTDGRMVEDLKMSSVLLIYRQHRQFGNFLITEHN